MPRIAYPLFPAAAAALALLAARPAAASTPNATYVVPTKVELTPSDAAATHVVIHGAFFQLTSTTDMKYGDPKCGYMSFDCVAGQEAMCRMQWTELRAAISATPTSCQGFGSMNTISTAVVHAEGDAPGVADKWDLGLGVTQGIYVDNKCPAALLLKCGGAGLDGGTASDAAIGDASAVTDGSTVYEAPPDDGSSRPAPPLDAGQPPPPPDAAASMDAAPAEDAPPSPEPHPEAGTDGQGTSPPADDGCGKCAVSGGASLRGSLAALGLAALGLARARRRRR